MMLPFLRKHRRSMQKRFPFSGSDVWINNLEEKEDAFLAAVKERTTEEATRSWESSSSRAKRPRRLTASW